jgi:hypothetical protein
MVRASHIARSLLLLAGAGVVLSGCAGQAASAAAEAPATSAVPEPSASPADPTRVAVDACVERYASYYKKIGTDTITVTGSEVRGPEIAVGAVDNAGTYLEQQIACSYEEDRITHLWIVGKGDIVDQPSQRELAQKVQEEQESRESLERLSVRCEPDMRKLNEALRAAKADEKALDERFTGGGLTEDEFREQYGEISARQEEIRQDQTELELASECSGIELDREN